MRDTHSGPGWGRSAAGAAARRRTGEDDAPAARERTPLIVAVMMALMIFVPIELSLRAGSFFMPWYRVALLLVAVPVLLRAFGGGLRLRAFDWCVAAQALWVFMAGIFKRGIDGVQPGGSYILETLVMYLIMRLYMRSAGQFAALPRLLVVLMIVPVLLSIPEAAILHERFVHDFARSLTGYYYNFQADYRYGLLRAASLFEHPILFGLFCSCTLSLAWAASRSLAAGWTRLITLTVGVVMTMSSAPILTMLAQFGLLLTERTTRWLNNRLTLFVAAGAAIFVFLSFASNRGPIGIIATGLALNPQSGYYRLLIWEHGIDDVLANPFIGIRPETWTKPAWMSESIDNHWLYLGMQGGLPAVFLLLGAFYAIWRALSRAGRVAPQLVRLRQAWGFTAISLILGAATVAYFGKMLPFMFMMLGYGAALSQILEGRAEEGAEAPPEDDRTRRRRNRVRI